MMAAASPATGAPSRTRARTEQVPPTVLANGIEVALHTVPRMFVKDLQSVLPDVDMTGLLIVPTCQKAAMDLVATGADVATEKDRLLEKFNAWAEAVRALLAADGCWMDYVDPCSGLPVHTRNLHILYPEVDTMETLLRYRTEGAGPCKILHHPRWGSACYPATAFVRAPGRDARWILAQMERVAAAPDGAAATTGAAGVASVGGAAATGAAAACDASSSPSSPSSSCAPSLGVRAAGGAAAVAHGGACRGAPATAAAGPAAAAAARVASSAADCSDGSAATDVDVPDVASSVASSAASAVATATANAAAPPAAIMSAAGEP